MPHVGAMVDAAVRPILLAALLGSSLAALTPTLRAEGASAATMLTTGNYVAGQGALPARTANNAVSLTVPRFQVAPNIGGRQAGIGRVFLILSTEWQNTGGVKYIVPDVADHLFLVINGDRQSNLSDATTASAHPLSLGTLIVPPSVQLVGGECVFEIPDHGIASLELLFIDADQGDMHAQLYGHKPPARRVVATPVNNGLIEVTVLAVDEVGAIGDSKASAGQRFAVVQLSLRGLSKDSLVRFDPTQYSMLRDADGYVYAVAAVDGLDDAFTAETQLVPNAPARGALAFAVPASHSALELAIDLPGYAPMEIGLPNTGAPAHGGKPLLTFEDPETLNLSVLSLRRESTIGRNHAAAGNAYLVVSVLFSSKLDQGIEFQTAEQLLLLDADRTISVDTDTLEALPHALKENSVIPAHAQARFDVVYQVPAASAHFAIRYRGFQTDAKKPLPDVAENSNGR
ncbi:MAG: DUF4352 domain-containing protein [Steroidobacteraceae bacterium]|jgi:hypothetical protein